MDLRGIIATAIIVSIVAFNPHIIRSMVEFMTGPFEDLKKGGKPGASLVLDPPNFGHRDDDSMVAPELIGEDVSGRPNAKTPSNGKTRHDQDRKFRFRFQARAVGVQKARGL